MSCRQKDVTPPRRGVAMGVAAALPISIMLWIFLVPAGAWLLRVLCP